MSPSPEDLTQTRSTEKKKSQSNTNQVQLHSKNQQLSGEEGGVEENSTINGGKTVIED